MARLGATPRGTARPARRRPARRDARRARPHPRVAPMSTGISWTDDTWNPLVGCAHVSPGCDGCYAARETFGRLRHLPLYAGLAHKPDGSVLPRFTGEIRL